jgi:hypothetical protein
MGGLKRHCSIGRYAWDNGCAFVPISWESFLTGQVTDRTVLAQYMRRPERRQQLIPLSSCTASPQAAWRLMDTLSRMAPIHDRDQLDVRCIAQCYRKPTLGTSKSALAVSAWIGHNVLLQDASQVPKSSSALPPETEASSSLRALAHVGPIRSFNHTQRANIALQSPGTDCRAFSRHHGSRKNDSRSW